MEKLPERKYRATVLRAESVARGVKKITFKVDGEFSFLPQQYVWLELDGDVEMERRGNRRAFTILGGNAEEQSIEVVARISDSAFKQKFFSLKFGEAVYIHGPFGAPYTLVPEHHPENIIFIAGGTGISEFFGVLHAIKNATYPVRCFLLYLNDSAEVTPFLQELHGLMREIEHFDYKVQYKRFSWADVADVVQDMHGSIEWHVIGSKPMVEHVYSALESGGISRFDVIFREFYPTDPRSLTREDIQRQLAQNSLFTNVLQNSMSHIIITDVNGIILFANNAAEKITGFREDEILGNTPRLWGGMMQPPFYKDFWKQKVSGRPFVSEIINRRKSGETYFTLAHISPIFGSEENIIGYLGTEEDITLLKDREKQLSESETRLQFALEGNRDGLWDWNISSDDLYVSTRWEEILGFHSSEFQEGFRGWRKRIHPEDAANAEEKLQEHLDGTIAFYESKYRVRCKDDVYRWVLDRAIVATRDETGKATRIVGTQSDITQAMLREDELERTNRAMIDRELKMIELKKEIAQLKAKQIL